MNCHCAQFFNTYIQSKCSSMLCRSYSRFFFFLGYLLDMSAYKAQTLFLMSVSAIRYQVEFITFNEVEMKAKLLQIWAHLGPSNPSQLLSMPLGISLLPTCQEIENNSSCFRTLSVSFFIVYSRIVKQFVVKHVSVVNVVIKY